MSKEKEKTEKSEVAKRTYQSQKSATAVREEKVLTFWDEHDIFNKSLEKDAPNGDFVFYDGPPFATGLPHVGSLLSSIVKDVVGRYWTMKGYRVPRQWGWDCHGLPIENMIEKELGLKNKKEIYELGVDKFNEACRASVLRFADEWKEYVTRVGRWTEYDSAYKTMDNSYMESVWWFVSEMHKQGYLYEGRKVLLYCPHCETPLSKAEIAMDNSYNDVTEESVYVKFRVVRSHSFLEKGDFLLAWTTTPWTLPGNVALAVSEKEDYTVLVSKETGERFVVSKPLTEKVFGKDWEKEYTYWTSLQGKNIVGLEYAPLFEVPKVTEAGKKNTYTVLPADFVTTEEGTGIVHTAVIYGEDDYQLGLEYDLPTVPLLNSAGHFNEYAPSLIRGQYFKKAEKTIKNDLEHRRLLLKRENHTHSYPFCYRCGTELFYNALVSWFIDIQRIKPTMLKTNEDINWHPEHLKHGRYKHILENAPDWTISRNRFWATALPIWRNQETKEYKVFSSLKELQEHVPKSGNAYFVMRHGEAEHNISNTFSSDVSKEYKLTQKGREQCKESAKKLSDKGITKIYTSPFHRCLETAQLVAEELGLSKDIIVVDDQLGEYQFGVFDGKPASEFREWEDKAEDWYTAVPKGGESQKAAKNRFGEFLFDVDTKDRDEHILIVTHAVGLKAFRTVVLGADDAAARKIDEEMHTTPGQLIELHFVPFPHNANYELDLHRPYIDELQVVDSDGTPLERVPEVIDCWVESGSMPFASRNYPHSNQEEFERNFPADFIAEYIAQTRTWFYYMHAVSTLLFGKPSFKNVVTTGNVLASDGAKVSKSKKNYTDPLVNLNKYGADAMRYYLMSSVVMQAEDMSFRDEELKEAHSRVVNILWNTFKFYDLYKHERSGEVDPRESEHVLDIWILARLDEFTREVTKYMDAYDITRATRPLRDFVDDFSTWYVRRSRDRLKGDDQKNKQYALETFHFTLITLAKIIAPTLPFIAESVYRSAGVETESVHLTEWPVAKTADEKVLEGMMKAREVVSMALEARARANIKVRQPLQKLLVKTDSAALYEPYASLIIDEVNVKEVVHDDTIDNEVVLDIAITPELQKEGDARELMRAIQDMRKKADLQPHDRIALTIQTSDSGQEVVRTFEEEIKKTVGADSVVLDDAKGEEVVAGEHSYTIQLTTTH